MRNPFWLLLAVVFVSTMLHAQQASVPQGINYQSVARNNSGQILTNQRISLRLTIHDAAAGGAIVYSEGQTVTTNAFGTFGVVIGGGSIILGNFNTIAWGAADKYLQVEMDFTGGTTYTNMGVSQLVSVPYSLYAAASAAGITTIKYDTSGVLTAQTAAGNIISTPCSAWLTAGNANLNTTNNFIGTTDNIDLILKRGGKEAVRFATGGAFLATGDTSAGTTPVSGAGKRMMWIPAQGAFRAGTVTGTAWDNANIGANSVALGNDALASGANSFAIGNNVQSVYSNSIAIGNGLITRSSGSMVVGTYNDTSAAATGSIGQSDVMFQIGNGTSAATRTNAFTVGRGGQVVAPQLVTQTVSLQDTTINPLLGAFTFNPQSKSYVKVVSLGLPLNDVMTLSNGVRIGQTLLIESRPVVAIDGVQLNDSGNLSLSGAASLLSGDTLMLIWDGSTWVELGRSSNH